MAETGFDWLFDSTSQAPEGTEGLTLTLPFLFSPFLPFLPPSLLSSLPCSLPQKISQHLHAPDAALSTIQQRNNLILSGLKSAPILALKTTFPSPGCPLILWGSGKCIKGGSYVMPKYLKGINHAVRLLNKIYFTLLPRRQV